jgi:hypothetical protein
LTAKDRCLHGLVGIQSIILDDVDQFSFKSIANILLALSCQMGDVIDHPDTGAPDGRIGLGEGIGVVFRIVYDGPANFCGLFQKIQVEDQIN